MQFTQSRPPYSSFPTFDNDAPLTDIINNLTACIVEIVDSPHTFEQFLTPSSSSGSILRPLVRYLSDTCQHPDVVSALLILKLHFSSLDQDDRGVNESRGLACEYLAWRYLAHRSDEDLIDYLLHEVPPEGGIDGRDANNWTPDASENLDNLEADEGAALLSSPNSTAAKPSNPSDENLCAAFVGLNALEIAAVAKAKKFLSQNSVRKVTNGIWDGRIVFWQSLDVHSKKQAQLYAEVRSDPFSRLRVPKYQKAFEVVFFILFLTLYYIVLAERNPTSLTTAEVFLFVWIAAFAYDEVGELQDAGTLFYAADFWSLWDIGIIGTGFAFLVTRIIGLCRHDGKAITDISFDILSIEALFLVPRVCSLLTLNSYFGTLIPCLKEMTKDFVKFLSIVIILFIGFLTTFTTLARGNYTARETLWLMIKDVSSELMLIFVILTNILLLTSLIAILSQSLEKVMEHAREEYLFQYAVFVLEVGCSMPTQGEVHVLTQGLGICITTIDTLHTTTAVENLIPLVCFRPLRFFLSSEQMRSARIVLLKITHAPCVVCIRIYERLPHLTLLRPISRPNVPQAQVSLLSASKLGARPRPSRTFGGHIRSEAPPSQTTDTPKDTGATQMEDALVDLTDTLGDIRSKVEQLENKVERWQGRNSSEARMAARASATVEEIEALRGIAKTSEATLDHLLARVEG